jgi:preprotein translocase subunit SecY
MKKFFETLANIWRIEELKNKILITLGLLLVYRFGTQVTLPGIDATKLQALTEQTDQGIGWLINVFTGGAFAQASVFALGIMPYISASIVVQLMGIAVPYLQKLQNDGESGRKKMNQITRWLTIGITLLQGPSYIYNLYVQLPAFPYTCCIGKLCSAIARFSKRLI